MKRLAKAAQPVLTGLAALRGIDGAPVKAAGHLRYEFILVTPGSLAVDPQRQGLGLGHALLLAAEQWVRQRGGLRIRMSVVNVRQSLIAWYLRRGYHATGETNPFPYGDDRFGTPRRDDLSFLVFEKDLEAQPGG